MSLPSWSRPVLKLLLLLVLLGCPGLAQDAGLDAGLLRLSLPTGWMKSPAPPEDPDLVCALVDASQQLEFQVYLEEADGRSLEGMLTGLRYSVVIEQGASLLGQSALKVDGDACQLLDFQIADRRYLQLIGLHEGQKLSIHCASPAARFKQARPEFMGMIGSLRWKAPSPKAPGAS